MSQQSTNHHYAFYRNLPNVAPSIALMFEKLDQFPDNPRFHFELGEAAHQSGMLQLSVECFSKVTELAPHVEAGFFNLGNALFDLREFDKAKQAYQSAFSLNPDAGTLNNLGNSYAAMEDWQNAIDTFEQALRCADISPSQLRTARSNNGKALFASQNWRRAIANYQQAIAHFPNDIQFLAMQANCHMKLFEFGKATECLAKALSTSPNNPELLCQIAHVNFSRGRTLESFLCMSQAFSLFSPTANLQSRRLQMLTYCAPATSEQLLSEANEWAALLPQSTKNSISKLSASPDDFASCDSHSPLRVGILVQSLPKRGPTVWLPDCLGKCSPEKFQWFGFCDSPIGNETRAAFVQAGCKFEETSRLSDNELAQLINDNKLDLLIDMIGHGIATRLPVLAKKPARIQVAWCAFPISSGLPQIDFIWSDNAAIPLESEKHFSEGVVRFPSSCFCFQPSQHIELKPQNSTTDSPFRCGFLGQPEQLSEPLIEAMQSILDSIPDAELVFIDLAYRDIAFQTELREKFTNTRESWCRIRFECFDSEEDELNYYQQLDVTLDPFLVSSPQRSFESLWMGVPVVTLPERRLSARSTASILTTLKREEWIATTQSEYVNAVQHISECRLKWRVSREWLRAELLASPMCDTTLISRNIEHAIDETVGQFRLAKKPQ